MDSAWVATVFHLPATVLGPDFAVPVIAFTLAVLAGLVLFCPFPGSRGASFELHGYQVAFLKRMAASNLPGIARRKAACGGDGVAAALQAVVEEAMVDPTIRAEIFDVYHCVHCGSVKPAAWIADDKGNKKPHVLGVSRPVVEFLSSAVLVPVEKRGEPPKRQVVEGPRRADRHKAARCCVDWAIKQSGDVADGKAPAPAAQKAKKSPAKSPARTSKSPAKSPARASKPPAKKRE